tara:strand:- start:109 stop:426 length:318 start_codon:yes stop_codon:yes gene_type:complete
MSWDVYIGEFEKNITFNFSPLFRMMMPGGLSQLHGATADEAAAIIWHGFRSLASINEEGGHELCLVGSGPFVRGENTIREGYIVLSELWQACIEAPPTEKVLVFG